MLLAVDTWAIRYLIVNTGQWWLGHQVLIAPQWIQAVSWFQESVAVDLTRQTIGDAPVYHPSAPLGRDQELLIFKHYGRSRYWENEATQVSDESRS